MADTKIGDIVHYYDKIGVAVVHILAPFKVGDRIKVVTRDGEFEQTVESIQVEHENIKVAKKGQDVGLKLDQPAKKGKIFKVES